MQISPLGAVKQEIVSLEAKLAAVRRWLATSRSLDSDDPHPKDILTTHYEHLN
jgi:hypothetical protein